MAKQHELELEWWQWPLPFTQVVIFAVSIYKMAFFFKLVCFPLFSISISNGPSLALVDIIQKKLVTVLSAQDMSGKY